jgi:hypothetical protein
VLKRPLPDWSDEAGVAELADEIIAKHEVKARPFIDYGNHVDALSGDEEPYKFIRAQRAAVKAAERGNPTPLNNLLSEYSDYPDWFERETLRLAAEVNKPKKRGGQNKTRHQKLEKTATHRAAKNFRVIEGCLRELYPEVRSVRERAIEFAASQVGISNETLRNYVSRSRRARQRLI